MSSVPSTGPDTTDGGSGRPVRALTRRELFTFGRVPEEGHWIRFHRPAMACRFEILLDGADERHAAAAREALDEADRLEAELSVFRETSALSRLNRTAAETPAQVDADLFALLVRCRDLHTRTAGAFDITSTPLSRCWGFLKREGRLPSAEAIAAARAMVGMSGVLFDEGARTVRFERPGMELNLGSIGKGYALDRMAEHMRGRGVRPRAPLRGRAAAPSPSGGAVKDGRSTCARGGSRAASWRAFSCVTAPWPRAARASSSSRWMESATATSSTRARDGRRPECSA